VRESGFEGELDQFVAFSDFELFSNEPPVALPAEAHVAFVGSLERYKAIDVLIEAWGLVTQQIPSARLSIAGVGPLRRELDDRIHTLEIVERVKFLGSVSRPEVRQLFDQSCCLVLPSRSEGLGRVILEAMARARPVVATRVGGISEIVEDGRTGLLVPPEDPHQLSSALVFVLMNPDQCRSMGEEGRRDFLRLNPIREHEEGLARLAAWAENPR